MKQYAVFNIESGLFERIIELKDGIEPAPWMTGLIPSKAALKSFNQKTINLIFDQKAGKWKSEKRQNTVDATVIAEAKKAINSAVRDKINEPFCYGGVLLQMGTAKQFEYYDFLLSILFGMKEFPANLRGSNGAVLRFNSIEDLKKFFAFFQERKEKIKNIGRIVKYGGKLGEVEYTPIAECTEDQLSTDAIATSINNALDTLNAEA